MEKIRYQVLITPENYDYLRTQCILCKHKNLSETINLTIRNYKFILMRLEQEKTKTEIINNEIEEEKDKSNSYREQIVGKKPMPNLNDWFKSQKIIKPEGKELKIEKKKRGNKKGLVS